MQCLWHVCVGLQAGSVREDVGDATQPLQRAMVREANMGSCGACCVASIRATGTEWGFRVQGLGLGLP